MKGDDSDLLMLVNVLANYLCRVSLALRLPRVVYLAILGSSIATGDNS